MSSRTAWRHQHFLHHYPAYRHRYVVHACLIAAAAMVIMIPYSLNEIVAMAQFMRQNHAAGKPFWRTFWQGGIQPDENRDRLPGLEAPLRTVMREMWLGGRELSVNASRRERDRHRAHVHARAVRDCGGDGEQRSFDR